MKHDRGGLLVTSAFRTHPRPNSDVVALLERTLAAARLGRIKAIAVITVSPVNESETIIDGELTHTRTDVLIGGCVRAAHKAAAIRHPE